MNEISRITRSWLGEKEQECSREREACERVCGRKEAGRRLLGWVPSRGQGGVSHWAEWGPVKSTRSSLVWGPACLSWLVQVT